MTITVYIPTSYVQELPFFHSLTSIYLIFLVIDILMVWGDCSWGFDLYFPNGKWYYHLFLFFDKKKTSIQHPLFLYFLATESYTFFVNLDINPLSDMWLA